MKAILEVNEFQKIIDINKPLDTIRMFYSEPYEFIDERYVKEVDKVNLKTITFRLMGQVGQFLLYRP